MVYFIYSILFTSLTMYMRADRIHKKVQGIKPDFDNKLQNSPPHSMPVYRTMADHNSFGGMNNKITAR